MPDIALHPEDKQLEPGHIFDSRFDRSMNLQQRLHLMMTRVDYIQKEKPKEPEAGGKKLRYSIVSHDAVTALIRQHAVACGVTIMPSDLDVVSHAGNIIVVKLMVTFRSIDSDEEVTVPGLGAGIDPGDKGPGKAISYAFKYALLKALMLETGDDPDLDQDVERLTEAETELYAHITNLKASVSLQDHDSVKDALAKGGVVHQAVQKVSAEASARAPELRAQVSAIAREVGFNMREEWA